LRAIREFGVRPRRETGKRFWAFGKQACERPRLNHRDGDGVRGPAVKTEGDYSTENKSQPVYCVVFCVLGYASFEEAMAAAPDDITAHVKRSRELHENGTLPMLGAFLDESDEPPGTMAVTTSHEAAEEYVKGDPFFLNGKMTEWYTRE
jgi:uncharacterized protein